MKIIIGSDHAGFEYKKLLIKYFDANKISFEDCGTHNNDPTDYPDYAHMVSKKVSQSKNHIGVLVCGSANGVAMTANKHKNIRAAICWSEEIAAQSKTHNNANIICIPARFISKEKQKKIIDVFLSKKFEGGRHANRVSKINC